MADLTIENVMDVIAYIEAHLDEKLALDSLAEAMSYSKYHLHRMFTGAVGLDEKFSSMIGAQMDIRDKLKPIEWRLATLKKHIEQVDIYMKYKGKKLLTDTEQALFAAAHSYLKGVMNGKTTLPTKAWKAEYAKLTAEQKTLNQRYLALKNDVKEAEQIRKSVYSILRQEQREWQPRRAQNMEH